MNLHELQWQKLRRLLATILPANEFWRERLPRRYRPESIGEFVRTCPLLDKAAMMRDRETHPPYGTNLTWPSMRYTRFCQTSGTTGRPLAWIDTPEDWEAMLRCWRTVFAKAGVERGRDRVYFAFTFGPFLGFWTAFESALSVGLMAIPGGGMSSNARLQMMADHKATVICCTPTYAVRLGEMRKRQKRATSVRLIIVAGEPGGSIPATRSRIERLWPGAQVFDHHGLTECGPVSYQDPEDAGQLRVIEESHFAEVLDPDSGLEVAEGAEGELVLTTLDRTGCPLLRFRTGDRSARRGRAMAAWRWPAGFSGGSTTWWSCAVSTSIPAPSRACCAGFPRSSNTRSAKIGPTACSNFGSSSNSIQPPTRTRSSRASRPPFRTRSRSGCRSKSFRSAACPRFEFKSRRWLKAPAADEAFTPEAK